MTGTELAARVREARPSLPIVIATGFADPPSSGDIPGILRLDKPYRIDKLAATITAALSVPDTGANGAASAAMRAPAGLETSNVAAWGAAVALYRAPSASGRR